MVKIKQEPPSEAQLRLLAKVLNNGGSTSRGAASEDVIQVNRPVEWNVLHALANRALVDVRNGRVFITKEGHAALQKKPTANRAKKKPTAKAMTGSTSNSERQQVRFS